MLIRQSENKRIWVSFDFSSFCFLSKHGEPNQRIGENVRTLQRYLKGFFFLVHFHILSDIFELNTRNYLEVAIGFREFP